MALGEARSGSGQNFWSVLAQGLAGGAAAVPNALQQDNQNKLAKMGAIFDAQQMIMSKQQHEQQMALNSLRMRETSENLKLALLKSSTYESDAERSAREAREALENAHKLLRVGQDFLEQNQGVDSVTLPGGGSVNRVNPVKPEKTELTPTEKGIQDAERLKAEQAALAGTGLEKDTNKTPATKWTEQEKFAREGLQAKADALWKQIPEDLRRKVGVDVIKSDADFRKVFVERSKLIPKTFWGTKADNAAAIEAILIDLDVLSRQYNEIGSEKWRASRGGTSQPMQTTAENPFTAEARRRGLIK